MKSFIVALAFTSLGCAAQPGGASEFPLDSIKPDAPALKAFLDGKVFRAKFSNGADVRSEFSSRGYLYVDAAGGFRDSGEWRTEDGKLCGHMRGLGPFCNDVRLVGQEMLLRRGNGEIVRYQLR